MLATLGFHVRIQTAQFLGMYEVQLLRQAGLDLRIHLVHHVFRTHHGSINAGNDFFQEIHVAVGLGDDTFPVPLVDVQRVQIAQLFVSPDSVHVCVDAISRLNAIFGQRQTLPLRKRMHHFGLRIAQVFYREGHSTLHTIQVVVDTHSLQYKQRCRDTAQTQFRRKVHLKEVLNLFNAKLRLLQIEQGSIALRFYQVTHDYLYLSLIVNLSGKDKNNIDKCYNLHKKNSKMKHI